MKFRFISDIHLERDWWLLQKPIVKQNFTPEAFSSFYSPSPLDGDLDTVLVIAGDLWNVYKPLMFCGSFSWLGQVSKQFKAVILVLGNHDYWGGHLTFTPQRMKKKIEELGLGNVHLLEKDAVIIDGVKFVGGTLWTDFNKSDPFVTSSFAFSMNDSKFIKASRNSGDYSTLKFYDLLKVNSETRQFLLNELQKDPQMPTVMVSHHAPSYLSKDSRYASSISIVEHYYYSSLEYIPLYNDNLIAWVHGHIHESKNYVLGNCVVLANPRGYLGYQLNKNFDDKIVVDTDYLGRFL